MRVCLSRLKAKNQMIGSPRKQTLFRSIEHGDDVDRPVMKSDGSWTYFAPDIAYHYDKVQRGYDLLIDIFGADPWWLRQTYEGRRFCLVRRKSAPRNKVDATSQTF